MPDKPIHGPTHRAYCGAMRRVAAITTALLVLGACSGGSDTEPLPLATEAPTTTEAEPTTSTTTTSATTTTSTSPSTSVLNSTTAPTLTTVLPRGEPQPSIGVGADIDAKTLTAAAFAGYERAWSARRDALADPDDMKLREPIFELYVDNENRANIIRALDSLRGSAELVVEDPENPNTVELIEGLGFAEDGSTALLEVCEVLNEDLVDATSGAVTFSDPFSYKVRSTMTFMDGLWKIESESFTEQFPNQDSCDP